MPTVTLVYTAHATNLSAVQLAAKLALQPLDPSLLEPTIWDLVLLSDNSAPTVGNEVARTIVYTLPATPPVFSNAEMGDMLANYYTGTFSDALSTPVVAAPPVVA
jgi:hypothetical protein